MLSRKKKGNRSSSRQRKLINHNMNFFDKLNMDNHSKVHRKIGDAVLKKNFKKYIQSKKKNKKFNYHNINELLNNVILDFEKQNKTKITVDEFARGKNRDPNESYRIPYKKQMDVAIEEMDDISINKKLYKRYLEIFNLWIKILDKTNITKKINVKKHIVKIQDPIFYNFVSRPPYNFFHYNIGKLGPFIDPECKHRYYNTNIRIEELTDNQTLWCRSLNKTMHKIIETKISIEIINSYIKMLQKKKENEIDIISKEINIHMLEFIFILKCIISGNPKQKCFTRLLH